MNLTDCHVHLYSPAINRDPAGWAAAAGEAHWAELSTRRRKDGRAVQVFPSLDGLLREMDAAGVARAVLLGWYWEKPATCVAQNRFYARCVQAHPDRLAACATIHPAAGNRATLAEVRRAHGEGLVGLGELSPQAQGYAVEDATFNAALELAAALGWPVNLHVTDPDSGAYPGRVATPLKDFIHLAQRHPATTFILAHWGGLLPLREPAARSLANVYYDTAASPLLYDEGVWSRFLGVVSPEHVLFGSDFPLNVYPRIDAEPGLARLVAELHRSGLTAEQLRAVAGENARRLFRG
jgi:predicted TIM-barrel fold metal-dependent hydrolase